MKKTFFTTVYVAIAIFGNTVFAQSDLIASNPVTSPVGESEYISNEVKTNKLNAEAISSKVMRSFVKAFDKTENVNWYDDKGYHLASFQSDDRRALAWFNKKGYMSNSILYGTEKHLPAAEKQQLQSAYEDYDIIATQEVMSRNTTAWIVVVQNEKKLIRLRLMGGEIEQLEKIQRTK